MPVVRVDVISPWPEAWGLCPACEMVMAQADMNLAPRERSLEDLPAAWHEEAERLAALLRDLAQRYGERIAIRLWDPRSLQGMWKSIRHGVRRYPTFIVDGGRRIAGWNVAALEQALRGAGLA
ncbi:MAG: hypothetical protein NTY23_10155 [Chloroflexi bacterium]|nr:hypothetical protein [Chloroflexota bacterium]